MPEITENYINIPLRNASLFVDGSLKTITLSESKGIKAVIGKLRIEPNAGTRVQKYIFDKNKWDMESAQAWVNDHKTMHECEMGENEIINFNDDKEKPMEKIKKLYNVGCKDFNDEEKSFIATASTEDIDRDGDILMMNGWRLKNYKKNPVILWQHDASLMPIAKAEEVWKEDKKLKFKPVFAPSEVNPFAQQVYNAYKKGFLTSFSVRFDPIEFEDMPIDEDNPTAFRGRKYKAQELLEISAVNIPSNPQATKSAELIDFVVKSYFYENKGDMNMDLSEIYSKSNNELKEKITKLFELKEISNQIKESARIKEIEQFVDTEIEKLSRELEGYNKNRYLEIELANKLKELQGGITALLK
jgi:HK97 family phage prohead protease